MQIHNQIEIATETETRYIDSREIKKLPTGIKVRLYGEATMGYSYFQKTAEGKIVVVRSEGYPKMENQTDGYQGAEQKPAKNLYCVAWSYLNETPVLLTLDKIALITAVTDIINDKDLADALDYDLKMTFDKDAAPADKYTVTRLDKTTLTKDQETALAEFSKTCDLAAHAKGGEAFTPITAVPF